MSKVRAASNYRPHEFGQFVVHAVAWTLADLGGRTMPGVDDVKTALSFRDYGGVQ